MLKFQRWFIFAAAFLCFAQVTIDPTTPEISEWLNVSSAEAKSRGGGSSSRSSSSSSRSSSSSSRSSSSSSKSSSGSSSSKPSSSSGNTGGRVRGGSFDRKPAPAPSSAPTPKPTSPSYPSSRPSYPSREYTPSRPIYIEREIEIEIGDDDDDEYPYRQQNPYPQQNPAPYVPGGTPVQPVPLSNSAAPGQSPVNSPTVPNSSTAPASTISTEAEEDGFPWGFVVFLLVVGVGVFLLWYLLSQRGKRSAAPGSAAELTNDTVTVTQLQVALLAEARDIQTELTDLGLEADLETPEGLSELLQETALALLRKPEYWSHVRSVSQTVRTREAAQRLFEQMSIAERSKFGVESFSRVNDRVRDRSISVDPDREPAEYIVVTLLVATEDDRPLFDPVYSAEDLKHALETLAAVPPSYLAVFELLWSPQVSTDSLSYDELLTQYADMMPLG